MASIKGMVERGAAISVIQSGVVLGPWPVVYVEAKDGKLFWSNRFPQGDQDSHTIDYDRVEGLSAGVRFYKGKDLVAYLAEFAEWPELDVGQQRLEHAEWKEFLKDETNALAFRDFIEYSK